MKVFLSTDLEGAAGVVDLEQCVPGPRYEHAVELLTGEVNAAIEGATAGGATEFVVNDAHYRMSNLRPETLAGRARCVSGRFKPLYMMEGLDESFDAVFFIAYHGSPEAERAVLSHTYSPAVISDVRIDGEIAGEAGINALVADAFDVPVVLITGDQAAADESAAHCPGAEAAVVKRSITRAAAESLHPLDARDLIRERARAALENVETAAPRSSDRTVTMSIRFATTDAAELASRIVAVDRVAPREASITASPLEVYRTFVTVLYLCRGMI